MTAPSTVEEPPSLLGSMIRRSIVVGRIYLVVAIIYLGFLGVGLSFADTSSFVSAVPLFLPIFAVVGSMGALTVFSTDRVKGVFEYLIAYGVSPRRLFVNVILASLALATIVLGVAVSIAMGAYFARGHPFSTTLVAALGVYSLPMSYACVAFAATVGVFWTSLSTPRAGMNNPVGLIPIVGIAPSLLTLLAIAAAGNGHFFAVAIGAVVLVAVVVLVLLSLTGRLLHRERLLSPT
jgi:hypothetical protein